MSTVVLVHGSWHGAWCWHQVVPRLEAAGHTVLAPELPAHGIDPTPADAVTFDDYVDAVVWAIDAADEPVTLVGHSMGGHPVTQAAEARPEAVERLVYLTAFLPRDGQALTDLDFAAYDSAVPKGLTVDEDAGVISVDPDHAVAAFYHDCPPEVVALGRTLLRPEPIGPRTVPVELTEANYGSVSIAYVECTEDRALPVGFQRELQGSVDCETVRSLETGHSPFFAAPEELAETLAELTAD